jgi:hypothetical protein
LFCLEVPAVARSAAIALAVRTRHCRCRRSGSAIPAGADVREAGMRNPIFLCLLLAGSATAANATTIFDVDTTDDLPDANPGDSVCAAAQAQECSLRAAFMEASAVALASSDEAIEIRVPPGEYELTLADDGDFSGGSGDLDLTYAPGSLIRVRGYLDGTPLDAGQRPVIRAGEGFPNRLLRLTTAATIELEDLQLHGARVGSTTLGAALFCRSTIPVQPNFPAWVKLSRVLIADNESESPAAAIYTDGCRLDLLDTSVEDNRGPGPTVWFVARHAQGTSLTLRRSSVVGNGACTECGGSPLSLHLSTDLNGDFPYYLTVLDSTIAQNAGPISLSAPVAGESFDTRTASLQNTTIVGNGESPLGYDGLVIAGRTRVRLANTLLAGRSMLGTGGWLESVGYNALGPVDVAPASTFSTMASDSFPAAQELGIGPLLPAGSYSRGHGLAPGSVLIDAGNPDAPSDAIFGRCATQDQRQLARPQGMACDIGALEREVPLLRDGFEDSPAVLR